MLNTAGNIKIVLNDESTEESVTEEGSLRCVLIETGNKYTGSWNKDGSYNIVFDNRVDEDKKVFGNKTPFGEFLCVIRDPSEKGMYTSKGRILVELTGSSDILDFFLNAFGSTFSKTLEDYLQNIVNVLYPKVTA